MSESIAIAVDDTPLQPGMIRFSQAAIPPLTAGNYRMSASQIVKLQNEDTKPTYQANQDFTLQGPRFALALNDVQMVVPPANQPGDWENTLPNLVLRRRVLPWVRTIDGTTAPPNTITTPWMALIVLTAAELGGTAGDLAAKSPVTPGTAQDLVQTGNTAVAGPVLRLDAEEKTTALLYLDLDAVLFQSLAPTLTDLPYLAHVRDVNTDQKEILGLDEDGSFSVVVGNRTVQTDPDKSVVNYAFLISVEGHQDHLPGSAIPAGVTHFRFAALSWWKIEATAAKGDFIDIMQNLPNLGGVGLVGMPHRPITGSEPRDQTAEAALSMSYVPLTYRMRAGEQATAWYRGPFSSVPTKDDGLGAFQFSDQAIRYDPDTALFDLSQAAAWQIGRLLGLSDGAFARQLHDWRKAVHDNTHEQTNLTALARALPEGETILASISDRPGVTHAHHKARLTATLALASAVTTAPAPFAVAALRGAGLSGLPRKQRREDRPSAAMAPQTATDNGDGHLDTLLDRVFGPGEQAE